MGMASIVIIVVVVELLFAILLLPLLLAWEGWRWMERMVDLHLVGCCDLESVFVLVLLMLASANVIPMILGWRR